MIDFSPLTVTLKQRHMTWTRLHEETGIGLSTFYEMKAGRPISMSIVERICVHLGCEIKDVCRYVKDGESIPLEKAPENRKYCTKYVDVTPLLETIAMRKVTMKQISKNTGFTGTRNLASGKPPTWNNLVKICEYLQVDPMTMYRFKEEQ